MLAGFADDPREYEPRTVDLLVGELEIDLGLFKPGQGTYRQATVVDEVDFLFDASPFERQLVDEISLF